MTFIERIEENIRKTLGAARNKSKGAWKIVGMNSRLLQIRKDREKHISELGEFVYRQYSSGEADTKGIMAKCREIEGLEEELETIEKKVNDFLIGAYNPLEDQQEKQYVEEKGIPVETGFYCTCGMPVYSGKKFCGKCGNNVEEYLKELITAAPNETPKPKFCGNCGSKREDNDRFCQNCGFKVSQTELPDNVVNNYNTGENNRDE